MAKKKGIQSKLKPVKYTTPQEDARLDATLSIRLPNELKTRLQDFSEASGLRTNTLMNHLIKEFLEAQGA